MDNNNEFFKTVDSTSKPKKARIGIIRGIFIPFASGVLGTILVVGLYAKVPYINEKVNNFLDIKPTSCATVVSASTQKEEKGEANEVISTVTNEKYSETSINAANKVLPSIVGITVEYTVNSPYYGFTFTQNAKASGSGVIISNDESYFTEDIRKDKKEVERHERLHFLQAGKRRDPYRYGLRR